jgi:redox-sensitive bicupin YhaK (pirin superfamily)
MQTLRPGSERGYTEIGWLKSWHSFSFGEYFDAEHMGFGPLRVINEDIVAPGGGFPMHGHANMEIITYILSGQLEHRDSLGNGDIIRPGEVQAMSAGKGILHSEFNPSDTEPVHLLQIWIMPQESGGRPAYRQAVFAAEGFDDRWQWLVTPDGRDGTLPIRQDATLRAARMTAGKNLSFDRNPDKKYWLQVARGKVTLDGATIAAGDGLAISGEDGTATLTATAAGTEILLFELPL